MSSFCARTTLLSLLLTLPLASASSQITIGGNIWDGNGGPLLSGNVYHVTGTSLGVPAGQTLTVQAGAVVKFNWQLQLSVFGTLLCNGTAGSPVVFTSVNDDQYGGDSNGDGPSVGGAGEWRTIDLHGLSGSVLDNVIVRFAGGGNPGVPYPGVDLFGSDAALTNCTIENNSGYGLNLQGSTVVPTVSGCTIQNNGNNAVYNVTLPALTGFSNNTVSGNGGNFAIMFSAAALSSNVTLGPDNLPGGALVVSNSTGVAAGASLTLEAGSIVKFTGNPQVTLSGQVFANGTAAQPVVFTDYRDDDHGGDTNNDGPSNGTPGAWRGLHFDSGTNGSVLTHTIVRYAGGNFTSVRLIAADITLDNCTIRDGSTYGLDLSGNTYGATVRNCSILNNAWNAIYNVPLEGLAGFFNNSASGNGPDTIIAFSDNNIDVDTTLFPENLLNNVLVCANHIGVLSGATLRIEAGVIIKMTASFFIDVPGGGLEMAGTAFDPVVVTSYQDDTYGGDSNGDGAATLPAKADWRGIRLTSSSWPSRLENVLLRYGGGGFYAGVRSTSMLTTLRAVRVEHWWFNAFELLNHTSAALGGEDAANLVAFDCGGNGFEMVNNSNFNLWHCTAVACVFGFAKVPAWQGQVTSSISWGNISGNYSGFVGGDLFASDGHPTLAGTQGNLFVDPMFVDPSLAVGDLHLQPGSICANTAQFPVAQFPTGIATTKDADENSRVADYGNLGVLMPDMGAYELVDWVMDETGVPRLGATLSFNVNQGPPDAQALWAIGFFDIDVFVPPYGFLLTGIFGTVYVGLMPTNQTMVLTVPNNPGLDGLPFGVQAGVISNTSTQKGITNLYRGRIRL